MIIWLFLVIDILYCHHSQNKAISLYYHHSILFFTALYFLDVLHVPDRDEQRIYDMHIFLCVCAGS